jgi:beta-glucosidase
MRQTACALVVLIALSLHPRVQNAALPSADIEKRVESLLGQMTLEEKIDMLGGENAFYIRAIPRLKVPAQKMADGPLGVRNYGPSTAYAAGIALAASWDTDLANRVGTMIGHDARARGVHFLLGPGANIYRAPMNGRNFEYFGEDPFLAARTAVAYIKGVQSQGVIATIKHFMGNNQEYDRHNVSSEIDERTMREIYLPAFEAAVREARVGAIMSSYNPINGVYSTQHDYLNNQIVKKEWGFDGIIMSDWGATYDGVAAANGGLDLEMPSGRFMNRATLVPAIKEGKVSTSVIDDKIRRILRKAIEFGFLDRDQTDLSFPLYSQQARQIALDAARGSIVLLKNDGGLLPLDRSRVKSIAVIGPTAYPTPPVGGGSGQVQPFSTVSYMEGMSNYLGQGATVFYHAGVPSQSALANSTEFVTAPENGQPGLNVELYDNRDLSGKPVLTRIDRRVNVDAQRPGAGGAAPRRPSSTRWTGYFVPRSSGSHILSVGGISERSGCRAFVDDKLVLDNWDMARARLARAAIPLEAGTPHKVRLEHWSGGRPANLSLALTAEQTIVDPAVRQVAARADAALVFVGFDPTSESEGADRTFALPLGQDDLIDQVVSANKNTIVVVTAGGAVDMSRWLDRVPALLQAWYAGQESGRALPQIVFGEVSPSGKLPVTFERHWEDSAVHLTYYPQNPGEKKVTYKEGVFVGYRHFDKTGTKPMFPFGYGLSYTTFAYGNLSISPATTDLTRGVTVSFDVTNTGTREGAEVAQLYVSDPHATVPRPPKELKGFAKLLLKPGEKRRASIELDRRAFSYYDVNGRQWKVDRGDFEVLVGPSSARIELRGQVRFQASAGRPGLQ